MIYTLTLNPAIDEIAELQRLEINGPAELLSVARQAAGKGINVSRALKTLGRESVPVVLVGSQGIPFFRSQMADAELPWVSFSYEGEPRVSNTLIFGENGFNTHIRKPNRLPDGFDPTPIFAYLLEKATPDDYVVLSGSLPEGIPDDTYGVLITALNEKGVMAVLDSSGDALTHGIAARPFCLKLDMDEFIDFTGQPDKDSKDFKATLEALHHEGVSLVIITMGTEGALLSSGGEYLLVRTRDKIKELEQRYTVGNGDVFLAAFIDALVGKSSLEECMKAAVATAAANALQPGAALFDPADCKRYLSVMEVKREL